MKTSNTLHQPRQQDGRYDRKEPCDGCGKPCTGEHYTDDEACGGSDGPGFYVCARVKCNAKRDAMTLDERITLYIAHRAINDAAKRERQAGLP